jgi:hypothetical protein
MLSDMVRCDLGSVPCDLDLRPALLVQVLQTESQIRLSKTD